LKKEKPILEWKVKCSNHFHKMGISPKGKIIFFNHTKEEIKSEKILTTLTQKESENGCYNFLQIYKKFVSSEIDISDITRGKKVLLSECVLNQKKKAADRRFIRKNNQNFSSEENNFWFKISNRIRNDHNIQKEVVKWFKSLLKNKTEKDFHISARFNVAENNTKNAGNVEIDVVVYDKAYMAILIDATVTIKWFIAYKKNFAFIKNYFVVDVLKKLGDDHYLVKAAEVNYDNLENKTEVKIQEIEIKKEENGAWYIVNKKKNKKKPDIILEASLRCSGHIHKIGITEKGDIIFFNHTKQEIRNERLLEKLSGVPSSCQCYNFLKEFKVAINSHRPAGAYFSKHTQVYKKILNSYYITKIKWEKMRRKENLLTNSIQDFKTYMAKKVYTEIYTSFRSFLDKAKEKVSHKTSDIGYIIGKIINIDVPNSIYYEKSSVIQPQINFSLSENDYDYYSINRYIFTIYYSYKWHIIYKKFFDVLTDFFIISIKEKIVPDTYMVSGLYIDESGRPVLSDATVKKTGDSWEIKLLQKDLSF
jgi:hypothetical protein